MLKLNIKSLSIKKKKKIPNLYQESYTKSHIVWWHESSQVFIAREGRWFIVVRDTFTDTTIQTETDDVSQDWRRFKYLPLESESILGSPPFLARKLTRKEWDFFLRGRPVSQPPPSTTPLRSFKGILSPGHAAPNTALWRWIIETFIPPRFASEGWFKKFRGPRRH